MKLSNSSLLILVALTPSWSDANPTPEELVPEAAAADGAMDNGFRRLTSGPDTLAGPATYTQAGAAVLANTVVDASTGAVAGFATLVGNAACAATFTGGGSFGLESGIVLSSGKAVDLVGPNLNIVTSTDFGDDGEPDTCRLLFEYTCPDNAVLVPSTGKFVWGSDEYFGRSVDDDGQVLVNGVNVATPASLSSVTAGDPTMVNNTFGIYQTEMDGFTLPKTLAFTPQPGVNTVSIRVRDDFDGLGDSALHILANSFGCCAKGSGVCGDPHFTTWHGEKYNYHGQCDLELLSDPTFEDGQGLNIHVRTQIVRQWSYIKSAAIRIGDDILEVGGGADKQPYWINGEYQGDLSTIGGFPVTYKKANSKSHSYTIHMEGGNDDVIEIRTFKEFVRVDFKKPTKTMYGNSVGLLGSFTTGQKLGRDGKTVFTDNFNEFGQEWQVLPDAPMLFHSVEGPQAPNDKCLMPQEAHAEEKRRRLGESKVSKFEAEVACHAAGISYSDHDMCVEDVLSADDLEMAGIYSGLDGVSVGLD